MLGIRAITSPRATSTSPPPPQLLSPNHQNQNPNYQRSMSFPTRNHPNNSKKRFKPIQAFTETIPNFVTTKKKSTSLYDILRVKETASTVEIKSAYRSLAKRFHPDAATSESDSRDFMEIHKAYTTLSDPTARARYDMSIGVEIISFRAGAAMGGGGGGGGGGGLMGRTRRWETDQCW